MVEGYCIYAGWMLAAAMDVVFAAETRAVPRRLRRVQLHPLGHRRAPSQGAVFESRFITRRGGRRVGLVNRVLPAAELERETFA